MNVPTYHQLLAEQYEENAKNLLVFQKQYENEDGDVDYHSRKNYEDHELEEPELFNQPHEDRGTAKMVIPPKDFEDKTRNSIRYDKDVKTHIVDVDTRFRAYPKENFPSIVGVLGVPNTNPPSNVANFVFALPRIIKNAITIRITSMCFPNVFYTFSKTRENLSFDIYNEEVIPIKVGTITIREGNYKAVADIVTEIRNQLINIPDVVPIIPPPIPPPPPPTFPFDIDYDSVTNKIRIFRTDNLPFGLDFTPATIKEPYNNGLGYNLGYEQFIYGNVPVFLGQTAAVPLTTGSAVVPNPSPPPAQIAATVSQAVAESFPDIFGDSYVYIRINDYDVIEHQNFKQTFFPVFAKILLPFNTKNQLINDIDLLNVVQRQYNFLQPVNIQRLVVTIYDAYGNIIDMKGANFSFTLEIEEVLNPALYEKLRDL
jgi:hypothetical protein